MSQIRLPIEIRHSSRASSGGSKSCLLLLSYHFPPGQGAGALRWQKMAEYVSAAGWEIDVVTRAPSTSLDGAVQAELDGLPLNVQVWGVEDAKTSVDQFVSPLVTIASRIRRLGRRKTAEAEDAQAGAVAAVERMHPRSIASDDITWRPFRQLPRRAYGALYRLSIDRAWARRVGSLAGRLVDDSGGYQALVTCGPPHEVHVTGARIARKHKIPHVVDLRDPWRFVERLHEPVASPVWKHLSTAAEVWTVRGAALVIANTPAAARRLRAAYPPAAHRIISIPNGCDVVFPRIDSHTGGPLTVLFAGSIYLDRDPVPFFEGTARMIRKHNVSPSEFKIVFVGHVEYFEGVRTDELARRYGLAEFLELIPFEPRNRLFERLSNAHVLLSLPQDSDMAVPSKIYEYTGFPAWLLIMADPGSATWELLHGSGADLVPFKNPSEIERMLGIRLEQFRRGELPQPLAKSPEFLRSTYVRPFLEFLESLSREPPAP